MNRQLPFFRLIPLFLLCLTGLVNAQYTLTLDDVKFEESTGSIVEYINTEKKDIIIPETFNDIVVKKIKFRAFYDKELTSVILPGSIIQVDDYAFAFNQLSSISIPNSVMIIGDFAFCNNQLTSATIPNNLTILNIGIFYHNLLKSITIPDGITEIKMTAFSENQLTSVVIPDNVTKIGNNAFYKNKLTSIVIPENVTEIGEFAFYENKLTSIVIPDNVTKIKNYTFYQNQLTSVVIPNNVTEIGKGAFEKNQLVSVEIPNSVTLIGESAFCRNKLTSVTISNNVTSIGKFAFYINPINAISIKKDGYLPRWADVFGGVTISESVNNLMTSYTITYLEKQSITFEHQSEISFDKSLTLNATANSGLDITYSIVSGGATLADNIVTFNEIGDIVIMATQEGNDTFAPAEKTITINVKPIPIESITVLIEGDPKIETDNGTLQMIAKIKPEKGTNDIIIWTIVKGSDNANINESGLVTGVKNGEITVRATAGDDTNIFDEKTVTITNQNYYAPVITSKIISLDENSNSFNLDVTDEDGFISPSVWSISNNSYFNIDANSGTVNTKSDVVIDYEKIQQIKFTVTINDNKHITKENITVNIQNINDNLPTITYYPDQDIFNIPENQEASFICDFNFDDADLMAGGIVWIKPVYELEDPLHFPLWPTQLHHKGIFDFEKKRQYKLQMQVTEERNEVKTKGPIRTITINILDVDDEPPVIDIDKWEFTINKDMPNGTVIHTWSMTDEDTEVKLGSHTWPIINGNDNNVFKIVDGSLILNNVEGIGRTSEFELMFYATDGVNQSITKRIFITVDKTTNLDKIKVNDFSIYPNPANNQITISFEENCVVELISLVGKVVMREECTNELNSTLDVSKYQRGVYIVKLTSDNGKVHTSKITLVN